ncbi:MbnB/TglH/ChrH family RiPP precursor modification enzyme [Streptomyces sp. YKOK-I1]
MTRLGTGIGWRPEIADAVERMPGIDWVEVVAENTCPGHLPASLTRLRERGVTVVPHGVGLGLGGAERPDEGRLAALAERASVLGSPLVTEHIAFVRAGGPLTATPRLEAGHLLPVPRTRDALDVLCENVRVAQDALPVPLAVENIAALIAWPGEEMTEGQFLYELADRTGVRLLIDVANLYTNHVNRGEDPAGALDELPLEALAYVHVAGGFARDGVWHDSHAHPVPRPVLDILTDLASRVSPPGVLLERDENFPEPAVLELELEAIRDAVRDGERLAVKRELIRLGRDARAAAGAARTGQGAPVGRGESSGVGVGVGVGVELGVGEGGGGGTRTAVAPAPASAVTVASPLASAVAVAPAAASAPAPIPGIGVGVGVGVDDLTRQRLGLAQAALLSALVAGTPVPEGFDRVRIGVQARALAAKRAGVVAKVAPELPVLLGDGYRAAFLAYAQGHPMRGGYRQDALDFVERVLLDGSPAQGRVRRELRTWWQDRSGPAPRSGSRLARAARAGRALIRR